MNNSKKSRRLVRQNEPTVQKSQKHDANLQKNSTLYFQIGLILCLLASYTALEMTFAVTNESFAYNETLDNEIFEIVPRDFIIEKEVVEKKQPLVKQPKAPEKIEIVDNDTKEKEAIEKIVSIPEPTKPTKKLDESTLVVDPPEPNSYNILAVQKVPIYPGCESAKNNDERRECMSQKLGKLIQRKFDTSLGGELGLNGRQKIYVAFKINKEGNVEIQEIKSPHSGLEKEAKRVVNKIPQMEPGRNNKKPVVVSYTLPIVFDVIN